MGGSSTRRDKANPGPRKQAEETISVRPPANHTPTMGVQRPGNCFWGAHVPILHVIQAT